jgi:hypothetical protein
MVTCYNNLQLAAFLRRSGMDAGNAAYLVATAHPESNGCDEIQQGQPYSSQGWGIWQITPGNSEPKFGINSALLQPQANADAANAKVESQGLSAWTTISSGAYLPYFSAAKQAVSTVYSLPISQVNKLAQEAGAQTTGISWNPFTDLTNLANDIISSFLKAFGVPNLTNLFIRAGLVLFGAVLVLVGIWMLAGKQAIKVTQIAQP